jgi:hypothetical protein
LFSGLLPIATTIQSGKEEMKSERTFPESTPMQSLVRYGLDRTSENFEAAINAYVSWAKTRSVQGRLLLLKALTEALEKHEGDAFGALLPFISEDPDPGIVSKAALSMALLFYSDEKHPLDGPKLVARLCRGPEEPEVREGPILGGLMLIGDERVTPIIKEVWAHLPPAARIQAVNRQSEDVFSSHVLLLIDLLERESDERVHGSLAVALGNCAEQAEKTGILDVERLLPVWKALDKPFIVRRQLSRLEFHSEFDRRLDYLVDTEPGDPKVMPLVRLLWSRN